MQRQRLCNIGAVAVTFAGFLVRLGVAHGTFLNPDEALHFRLANQLSLALAYKESLTASHPPLLTFMLYFWRRLGTSELWLRMPSVVAGGAFCWMFYLWLRNVAGLLTAFLGLLLVAFLPPVIYLSAEIRQYALLLAFLAGALYFLDEAFAGDSIGASAAFSLCLYLAILSHYSAFFFAAALGIYALVRIIEERPTKFFVAFWAVGQAVGVLLSAFLYKTHLSKLGAAESRTVLQGWMSEFYLNRSYFEAGRDNPFLFVLGHSFGVFQFVFGQLAIGDLAGLLFIAAIIILVRGKIEFALGLKKLGSATNTPLKPSSLFALLLILPFVFVGGSSLGHFYPYGGTRHSAILVIPAIAGAAVAIADLSRQSTLRALGALSITILICAIFGKQRQPFIMRSEQDREHMAEAVAFVQHNSTPPDFIFTDYESELILGHYLCDQQPIAIANLSADFETFICHGVRVVSTNYKAATSFDAGNFATLCNRLQDFYQTQGSTVWVFQAGWKVDLAEELSRHRSEVGDLHLVSFGNNIKLFSLSPSARIAAGPSSDPTVFP